MPDRSSCARRPVPLCGCTRASRSSRATTTPATAWSRTVRRGRRRASRARPSRSTSRPRPTPDRSPWTRRMAVDDRLYRSRDDRMLAGVAGGVAERLDADPSIIRIVWALLIFLTGGLALLVYIVMAIVVPERPDGLEPAVGGRPDQAARRPANPCPAGSWVAPDGSTVPIGSAPPRRPRRQRDPADRARAGLIGGLVLIALGGIFLSASSSRRSTSTCGGRPCSSGSGSCSSSWPWCRAAVRTDRRSRTMGAWSRSRRRASPSSPASAWSPG